MARLPRLHVPDGVHYVAQTAIRGRALFVDADDGAVFLQLLEAACRRHGFALHAYALTPSSLHLLGTPSGPQSSGAVMQAIGRAYVPRINRKTGLAGALWDRRYRSTIIDPDWLVPVMRVVESHATPGDLAWSSGDHHAGLRPDPRVTDHARYWALSDTPFGRQAAYRELLAVPLDTAVIERVNDAVARGWALGSPAFVVGLAKLANRRVVPLARGRPRKEKIEVSPK